MAHIKEPNGIDLIVKPMPLSDEDRKSISAIIAAYKLTGEKPVFTRKIKATRKVKNSQTQTLVSRRKRKMPAST
jgi:hypothetical protein